MLPDHDDLDKFCVYINMYHKCKNITLTWVIQNVAQFHPTTHTHSNIHTNQTAGGQTIKYLKPILRCKALCDKTLCTPIPQKFSHKCGGINQGYMHITNIYHN